MIGKKQKYNTKICFCKNVMVWSEKQAGKKVQYDTHLKAHKESKKQLERKIERKKGRERN